MVFCVSRDKPNTSRGNRLTGMASGNVGFDHEAQPTPNPPASNKRP